MNVSFLFFVRIKKSSVKVKHKHQAIKWLKGNSLGLINIPVFFTVVFAVRPALEFCSD